MKCALFRPYAGFFVYSGFLSALVLPLHADEYAAPEAYYAGASLLSGEGLKAELHDIINDATFVTYSQVADAIRLVDMDPENSNNIILIYSGQSISYNTSSWNREHMWPQSFGATSPTTPYSDLHHLFPANSSVNSTRSNYVFTELPNGLPVPGAPDSKYSTASRQFEPQDLDKGRVARALFYMDVRYDGSGNEVGDFILTDFPNQFSQRMGRLSDLIIWNRKFGPDERERRRNHLIMIGGRIGLRNFPRQDNRNPFVDSPDWVDAIYTAHQYVSTGSWRSMHFSFEELLDASVSGDLADPDEDGVPNLIELSADTDPNSDNDSGLPRFTRNSRGEAYLQFRRLSQYHLSGLEYAIEHATDPLQTAGWQSLSYTDQDLQIAPGEWTDSVSVGDYLLPPTAKPAWLRLRVNRSWPLNSPGTAVHEPFRSNDWQVSPWLGEYVDAHFPFIFSGDFSWLQIASHDGAEVTLWHPDLEWLYSTPEIFPLAYEWSSGSWLLLESSPTGELRIYDLNLAHWRP